MMPEAIEISRAGICDTSPSPMVRVEKVLMASPKLIPRWAMPMTRPPIRLMRVMRTPAMASPLTNLEAPSMAP